MQHVLKNFFNDPATTEIYTRKIVGSVKFSVYLDGRKLMESPVLKDGDSIPVKTAVEGGRKLEIRVDDAGDGNAADWGIIANGMLTR